MKSIPANRASTASHLTQQAAQYFLGLVAVAAMLIFGQSNLQAQQAGNAQNGKLIFTTQKCATCHGSQGEGNTVGPQIGPPTIAQAAFVDTVRNPKNPMPAYSAKDVTDAQLADVYAFLKSVAPPAQVVGTPAGNVENGRQLFFRDGCYECHNRDASGARTGPKLAPDPLPYAAFSHQVRMPANTMPPYTSKVMSDTELADIYAYIQSLPRPASIDSMPLLRPH